MIAQTPPLYGIAAMLWNESSYSPGISPVLVNELRLAGFPEIQGGRIAFGSAALAARQAPPSVVAIWTGSDASGAEPLYEPVATNNRAQQPVIDPLATDIMRFDFHCWAEAYPPDPESAADADACRYLIHQLWRVIERTCSVARRIVGIRTEPDPATSLGFQAVLSVEFRTPVPNNIEAYVLPGTSGRIAVTGVAGATDPVTIITPKVA